MKIKNNERQKEMDRKRYFRVKLLRSEGKW